MSRSPDVPRPLERPRHHRVRAISIITLGLLLFIWPFVRTPPLDIGPSYGHLIGAWAAIIVAVAMLARALGRDADAGGGDA